MPKEPTETLYVRLPVSIVNEIRRRAEQEQRTIAVTTARMLTHTMLCEHKVTVTEEL
jgi:hypothetical protein